MEKVFIKMADYGIDLSDRVAGTYCKRIKSVGEFLEMAKGRESRRKAVNWHAYQRHGTLEFRIFPGMHDADGAMYCVDVVRDIINEWYNTHGTRSLTELLDGEFDDKGCREILGFHSPNEVDISSYLSKHDISETAIKGWNSMVESGFSCYGLDVYSYGDVLAVRHESGLSAILKRGNFTEMSGKYVMVDDSGFIAMMRGSSKIIINGEEKALGCAPYVEVVGIIDSDRVELFDPLATSNAVKVKSIKGI
jgi:hypothetical protein